MRAISQAARDNAIETMNSFETEHERDAYARGYNHGHGIACHNVPTMGDEIFCDSLGHVTVDEENIREVHEALCYEAESSSRDYSPFEFTAHEFNSLGEFDADDAWAAFDEGVADAIRDDLATYTDEDYGIE